MTVAKKSPAPKPTTRAKITRSKKTEVKKPDIHAKQITLLISVGTEDRDRDIETFIDDVMKAIKSSKSAKIKRAVKGSAYYILDGKVCLPDDYDPETQNFKPGANPPAWAGGPGSSRSVVEPKVTEAAQPKYLTREEADRRIAAGRARYATEKSKIDDDGFEAFEWDAEDAEDTAKMEEIAEKSMAEAKKTVAKRTIKKSASAKPPVTTTARKTRIAKK